MPLQTNSPEGVRVLSNTLDTVTKDGEQHFDDEQN